MSDVDLDFGSDEDDYANELPDLMTQPISEPQIKKKYVGHRNAR